MTPGELLNIILTPGNTDDRTPVPSLLQQLFGKVFADKGYIWQKLAKQLFKTAGIQLITKLKRNMKQRLMPLNDRLMLALARHYRNHYSSVKEHLSNRAFASSFSGQLLCQHFGWVDCLLPSAKEAVDCAQPQSVASGLTRTHVNTKN
jgi:hypothetical protein